MKRAKLITTASEVASTAANNASWATRATKSPKRERSSGKTR